MTVESTAKNTFPPPEELATSLTILEGETHRLIHAAEYIAHVSQYYQASPNLQRAIVFNEAITTWVQISVLDHGKIKHKSDRMSSFVWTAKVTSDLGMMCTFADLKACSF